MPNVRQHGLQIDRVLSQNGWDRMLGDLGMDYNTFCEPWRRQMSVSTAMGYGKHSLDHLGVICTDLKGELGAI